MYTVQKEIKTLRMKADLEEAKTREDTKIKALEGELDWFMTEAIRLDELCKDYKRKVDKWKSKAEALDEDRRFLEGQIKGAKRQNKILRAAAERARSSAYSALMVTRARAEVDERPNGGTAGAYPSTFSTSVPGQASQPPRLPPNADVTARPASAGAASRSGAGRALASNARAITPEPNQHQRQLALTNSGQQLAPLQSRGGDSVLAREPSLPSIAGAGKLGRGSLGSEAEERYVEAIQHLKSSIAREQHTVRMLQAARATQYAQKSDLEEFFLEVRRRSEKGNHENASH